MIKRNFTKYWCLSIVILMLSCAAKKETATNESIPAEVKKDSLSTSDSAAKLEGNPAEAAFTTSNRVGTMILARVEKINPPIESNKGSKSVCEKVACTAELKVESLQEVGRFFDYSFGESDIIACYFTFSVAPTNKELFPNIEVSYPGLKVGDRIRAYLLVQSPMTDFPYTIDHYEILKSE